MPNLAEWALLVTALGGFIGTGYSLTKVRTERRKLGADAAQVVSQSAIGLLDPMNRQIDALEARLTVCNEQIDALRSKVHEVNLENDTLRATNRELQYQVRELLNEVRLYRRENPPSDSEPAQPPVGGP